MEEYALDFGTIIMETSATWRHDHDQFYPLQTIDCVRHCPKSRKKYAHVFYDYLDRTLWEKDSSDNYM